MSTSRVREIAAASAAARARPVARLRTGEDRHAGSSANKAVSPVRYCAVAMAPTYHRFQGCHSTPRVFQGCPCALPRDRPPACPSLPARPSAFCTNLAATHGPSRAIRPPVVACGAVRCVPAPRQSLCPYRFEFDHAASNSLRALRPPSASSQSPPAHRGEPQIDK